jgi:hypothetical protein
LKLLTKKTQKEIKTGINKIEVKAGILGKRLTKLNKEKTNQIE